VFPAAEDWLLAGALPLTAAGPTNWLPHALGACEAIRREARTELWMRLQRPAPSLSFMGFEAESSAFIQRGSFFNLNPLPARTH
jgi:hypothetical protein